MTTQNSNQEENNKNPEQHPHTEHHGHPEHHGAEAGEQQEHHVEREHHGEKEHHEHPEHHEGPGRENEKEIIRKKSTMIIPSITGILSMTRKRARTKDRSNMLRVNTTRKVNIIPLKSNAANPN
ncbi:hypothetical protein DIU31_006130 [Mucilaginibacter rubeus]|uniref:Uncharacterized protein n=1 Tax=Mucilaginibacter rubeus TaxID=2027860 RepID=A0AAE6JCE1_9SPHI|nr:MULTISPECIES: hypothetical protein [Mucilaginibacter]QEM03119.1 hypothetical protein DIU31_006130 [Mucilaginibacter rubeus]QEM15737.1 hypothetical protein DIU38_006200 [Mucilaginibacter gossypii]QTE41522.1 hypothetical protein J3L19_21575 [Mucilaginibacter rubeus]QTE48128.1 hypothetical protein J3L21_21575 [Mucilaginibacter rubeus]QTE59519.1 hypothetical protein J3L23_13220 [Mucilaginibacter rubeus]